MEDFDFPAPRYNIGDRVILNPRDRRQYGAEELRFVGKLGVVMPTSKDTVDATDIPMVRFDGSYRKVAIAQDDLIPFDQEFVPHPQPKDEDREVELCPAEKHKMHEKNTYWRANGDVECRQCRLDANWEKLMTYRKLVGA